MRGVFLAIQASVVRMHDGGRVVTIGSNTAVRTGSRGSSVCAMTKAAVATMVKGIALDLAPRQITVNNDLAHSLQGPALRAHRSTGGEAGVSGNRDRNG